MPDLAQQRCFNHPRREAVAHCLECELFFCRECVTEHEDRVICAACVRRLAQAGKPDSDRLGSLAAGVLVLTGLAVAWAGFYLCGRLLVLLPSSFHEGTVWEEAQMPQ